MLRTIAKAVLPRSIHDHIRRNHQYLDELSIRHSLKEQDLVSLFEKLEKIVPDIYDQYTTFKIDSKFMETKVRALHAFQLSLVDRAFDVLNLDKSTSAIADIGDSSGTHIKYIKAFYGNVDAISVNLDEHAVNRIRKKGLKAVHCRAEQLLDHDINVDLFLAFEIMEHLSDPVNLLHVIATKTPCSGFIVTVPYVAHSRVGLKHIRFNNPENVTAENTHIFELSPEDWKLLFKHAGWQVTYEKIFLQYPKSGFLRCMKNKWRTHDFEGFYGAILAKDSQWSDLYQDWQ